MEGTVETVNTSEVSVPTGLAGIWQGTYDAKGNIRLDEGGEIKTDLMTSYEEVEPDLYRVTSDLSQYMMPVFNLGGYSMRWKKGFRISGNQLTYVVWTGPLNPSFGSSAYRINELSPDDKYVFTKQ